MIKLLKNWKSTNFEVFEVKLESANSENQIYWQSSNYIDHKYKKIMQIDLLQDPDRWATSLNSSNSKFPVKLSKFISDYIKYENYEERFQILKAISSQSCSKSTTYLVDDSYISLIKSENKGLLEILISNKKELKRYWKKLCEQID